MNMKMKIAVTVTFLAILLGTVLLTYNRRGEHDRSKSTYSQFLDELRAGQVASAIVVPGRAAPTFYKLKNGTTQATVLPSDYRDDITAMREELVNIEIQDPSSSPLAVLGNAAPFLILLSVWMFLMYRMRKGKGDLRLNLF
jgi:ATP-dependent Zn protease